MMQMNLFTRQKETHRCRKQTHGYTQDINYKIGKQQGPTV